MWNRKDESKRRANGTDYAGGEIERQALNAHKLQRQRIVGKTIIYRKQGIGDTKESACRNAAPSRRTATAAQAFRL